MSVLFATGWKYTLPIDKLTDFSEIHVNSQFPLCVLYDMVIHMLYSAHEREGVFPTDSGFPTG